MPSWSAADEPKVKAVTPTAASAATEIESARRLLEHLFAEAPSSDRPPLPER